MNAILLLLFFGSSFGASAAPTTTPGSRPNILLILADDLGYGDVARFNPESKIPTPNLDRLAAEGIRFTDAHAPGAVCVPSRYGLLTGRYPFRQDGNPSRGPLIEPDRTTLASMLRERGYRTAMVGKWHLGFEGGNDFNYDEPLRGGPVDRGFDYFFGMHASLDIPPYFYIENDRATAPATGMIEASRSEGWSPIQGAFWRAGRIAPDFRHDEVLGVFTDRSTRWLRRHFEDPSRQPFFLYVALAAPHTPWLPNSEFQGRSHASLYGDFVAQVDASVGRILGALDEVGAADETMVVFTSDNGPVWYPEDARRFGHSATGGLRGMKGDAWEGGHRMPFIVRWPGRAAAGGETDATICFTDMMATFAEISGAASLPAGAGEDSLSFVPFLGGVEGTGAGARETLVTVSSRGVLSIREGNWKMIPALGSGGFTKPGRVQPVAGEAQGQLFDLSADVGEERNLWLKRPEIVERLKGQLDRVRASPSVR